MKLYIVHNVDPKYMFVFIEKIYLFKFLADKYLANCKDKCQISVRKFDWNTKEVL
jgi:hypothetical protein